MSDHATPAHGPPALLTPLFPLPGVVLFPRAVLPLHIFEDRYKAMTRDALVGERRIAMALLRPGWEKSYHARPSVEPVVCIGSILSSERLPDGKYNFLLQGTMRARILYETEQSPYRLARLEPLQETPAPECDLEAHRLRMVELFTGSALAGTSIGAQFARVLRSSLSTPEVADLAAFNLLDDADLKQSLLADPDVDRRINRIVGALQCVCQASASEPVEAIAPVAAGRRFKNPGLN